MHALCYTNIVQLSLAIRQVKVSFFINFIKKADISRRFM